MSFSSLGAAVALAVMAAQDPTPPDSRTPEGMKRFKLGDFAVDIPERWRPLEPNEVHDLRDQLPYDSQEVRPGTLFAIGDVDAWLKEGYDGRALLVVVKRRSSMAADEADLESIRRHWQDFASLHGDRREVLSAQIVELGPDRHPALEFEIETRQGNDGKDIRALEIYVPTGGNQLIFSFRSWDDDFARARVSYRQMADSMTFARRPPDRELLGNRLLQAAFVGVLVGLVLLMIRRARRT